MVNLKIIMTISVNKKSHITHEYEYVKWVHYVFLLMNLTWLVCLAVAEPWRWSYSGWRIWDVAKSENTRRCWVKGNFREDFPSITCRWTCLIVYQWKTKILQPHNKWCTVYSNIQYCYYFLGPHKKALRVFVLSSMFYYYYFTFGLCNRAFIQNNL